MTSGARGFRQHRRATLITVARLAIEPERSGPTYSAGGDAGS